MGVTTLTLVERYKHTLSIIAFMTQQLKCVNEVYASKVNAYDIVKDFHKCIV